MNKENSVSPIESVFTEVEEENYEDMGDKDSEQEPLDTMNDG